MFKPKDPRELAVALLSRSTCHVQVAAVLADNWGIHSWGPNHSGPLGLGEHAEVHCLKRANPRRIAESTLYIAAQRKRNKAIVTAKPCPDCQKLVRLCKKIIYRDKTGIWRNHYIW